MIIMVPIDEMDRFDEYINEATNGEALVTVGEKEYV